MGFFGKLFRKTQASSGEPQMTVSQAWDIVSPYGEFMEKSPVTPGTVADVNELPFPKELIKQAVRILLVETRDSNMRKALKVGYCDLAKYQPGVGPVRVGFDFAKVDPAKNPLLYTKEIVDEGTAAEKWLAAVEAELNTLGAELKELDMQFALKPVKES